MVNDNYPFHYETSLLILFNIIIHFNYMYNQVIIFDDDLKILNNNYSFKNHSIQKNEFKLFDNITYENQRKEN